MFLRTTTERGRERYGRWRPVLRWLETAVAALPAGAARRLLVLVRGRSGLLGRALRFALVRRLAARCGELVDVREGVFLFGLDKFSCGDRLSIHPMAYVDATGGLTIGSDVSIAHAVTIMSTTHVFSDPETPTRDQPGVTRPTAIGDDVWIGAGARVLAGVTVGSHSVVGAGAVVTTDVPPGSVVVGVPARIVGRRGESR